MEEPEYRDADWLREQYHGKGFTQAEIGDMCDVAAGTISTWMQKHGIRAIREFARFEHHERGYEQWDGRISKDRGSRVMVHQLLAIAEGLAEPSELFGGSKHVHHRNGIPWGNWPSNLQVVDPAEHRNTHSEEQFGDKPWRDEDMMRDGLSEYTQAALSKLWGCSPDTISRWRDKHELDQNRAGPYSDKMGVSDL